KQRATKILTENKIYIGQNSFTKNVGHDILGQIVHDDWRNDPDATGPITEYVATDKQIMTPGDTFYVVANIQDWQTGGSNIAAARYRTDVNPGTYVAMNSVDGSWNSASEAAVSAAAISTTGWLGGWHTVWVSGRDALNNWGEEEAVQVLIIAPEPPMTPSSPEPADKTEEVPLSKVFSIYYEDYENNAGTVRFYWKDNPTPFATVTSVASKSTASTGSIPLVSQNVYEWYVTAQDATGTTRGPATGYWIFKAIDITEPMAVTGLGVAHDGPTGFPVSEIRYLRSVASEGGTGFYLLGTENSHPAAPGNWGAGNSLSVYLGIRVFKRTEGGTETEITTSLVATVSRTSLGWGYQNGYWKSTEYALDPTDSIVIKVYGANTANPTVVRASFSTGPLGAIKLDSTMWTMRYWTRYSGFVQGGSDWYWGNDSYNNTLEGFTWTQPANPLDHNTVSWTKSADDGAGADDVLAYKVYRSATIGPWDDTTHVATLDPGTQEYIDFGKGQADNVTWWYVVRAMDISGNEEFNTNAEHEPGEVVVPDPYNISLSTHSAGQWAFISFPSGMTGPIETLLNDATSGDGLTTWSVAKAYDNENKKWLTYRPGSPATLTGVDNTMGVWIKLDTHTGDKKLTLYEYAATPASTEIPLYAGWNLVGYPSETSEKANVALALTGADIISVYKSTTPFVEDRTDLDAVDMIPGNAYWVHVPAYTLWTVTNP
ncbi:MAG: hypothetical protein R6W91_02320, partial [Thermoplasmata archaeon]